MHLSSQSHWQKRNRLWTEQIFSAKAARTGGVVRRSVKSVEREIGRTAFEGEVRRRGFHLLECGDQFIVICSDQKLELHF